MQVGTRLLSQKRDGFAPSARTSRDDFSPLSMYSMQPDAELTLEDFELYAIDRLKILKTIEALKSRGTKMEDLKERVRNDLRQYFGDCSHADALRKDEVTHHILRLAYCNNEEKRRWFLNQELTLFKIRFESLSSSEVSAFMRSAGLQFTPISSSERDELALELTAVLVRQAAQKRPDFTNISFFKVKFTDVLDLVATRRVFIRGGFAYVPSSQLLSIVTGRFRAQLSRGLVFANKHLPVVLRDERLAPLLSNMSRAYVGPQYSGGQALQGRSICAAQVEVVSQSFPLCMRELHGRLKEHHHLKHGGRMQYGLFLKGIGLSLEEALEFWKREFTKKMTAEQFVKQYAYNIRHNYGKEGKRVNYTPYSCLRIINATAPGTNEYHGCPYKHWDMSRLRAYLSRMRLDQTQVDGIVDAAKQGDFGGACRLEFSARHSGADPGEAGNHPNAYFERSQQLLLKETENDSAASANAGNASQSNSADAVSVSAAV